MDFWGDEGTEISGHGYARGGYSGGGDKCPDHVPLFWSDPDSITFDASNWRIDLWTVPVDDT